MALYLYHKGVRKGFKVHQLVALHFIPNPENKPEVNHIDGNTLNNRVENLEWSTRIENEQHKKAPKKEKHRLRYTECTEIACPHHQRIEPYGYCSPTLHEYWLKKKK